MKSLSLAGLASLAVLLGITFPVASQEHRIEKKVVIIGDQDASTALAELDIDVDELECTEKDGYKVCVAEKVVTSHDRVGARTRGFLGVGLTAMTDELREHFGAPAERGVLISTVEPDSPAAAAGLQVGDILTAVDGDEIATPRDLMAAIGRREEGELATIEIYRDGGLQQITATLGARSMRGPRHRIHRWQGHGGHGPDLGELHESLQDLDLGAVGELVHEGLAGVDWSEIAETIHEALRDAGIE